MSAEKNHNTGRIICYWKTCLWVEGDYTRNWFEREDRRGYDDPAPFLFGP